MFCIFLLFKLNEMYKFNVCYDFTGAYQMLIWISNPVQLATNTQITENMLFARQGYKAGGGVGFCKIHDDI